MPTKTFSIIWLVPLIMLSLIPKIKLEQMSYESMFSTLLSHLISEEKPSASHMCASIKLHTYDRQKSVISLIVFKRITEFNHLLHSGMRYEGL
jgi:hypothetical protein